MIKQLAFTAAATIAICATVDFIINYTWNPVRGEYSSDAALLSDICSDPRYAEEPLCRPIENCSLAKGTIIEGRTESPERARGEDARLCFTDFSAIEGQ